MWRRTISCGMVTHRLSSAVLVLITAAAACSPAPRSSDVPLTIRPLTIPAAERSSLPQLSVTGGRALVSWIDIEPVVNVGTRATLRFAERTADGWSEPRIVASGTDWFINWADVPSVVRLDDGSLAAHWLHSTDEASEAYDLRIAFSKDDGRTWSAPVSPHHDGTKSQHGFASLFQMPGAGLGVLWLDGRQVDEKKGLDDMSVRAASFDRDGRQVSEALVDDRACDCCPTAVAIAADGPVAVYRDRSDSEVRDIATTRLVNGKWTTPALVHADGWKITACPINGPAIRARGREVVVAWMTAAPSAGSPAGASSAVASPADEDEQGRSFVALSQDAGATFGAPIRVDEAGSLGRVGIDLAEDGAAFVTWIEFANGKAQLLVRRVDASGRRGAAVSVAGVGADRASGFPRIARHGSELLFAWTETSRGEAHVRTAAARLD
jgi:hypothetical protein